MQTVKVDYITKLETVLRELSEAVREAGLAMHNAATPVDAFSALMLKWPRVTDAQSNAVDALSGDSQDTWKRVEARQAVMAGRIAELEHALTDVLNSYEDERARIKAGNADKPSVSGQTFIDRARRLLRSPS